MNTLYRHLNKLYRHLNKLYRPLALVVIKAHVYNKYMLLHFCPSQNLVIKPEFLHIRTERSEVLMWRYEGLITKF